MQPERVKGATVVLSGGAPNSPLVAGALAAIYEAGKTFDHFYTSGAGAVPGLLFVASRGMEAPEALENSVGMSAVSDEIYDWLPVGYKSFFKPGPFAVPMMRWAQLWKVPAAPLDPKDRHKRLYNDFVDLWATMLTPTWLTYFNRGICPPYPFVNEVIDFAKLKQFKGTFVVNAYNIDTQKEVQFHKRNLDAQRFAAAFAYPFIYQPVAVDGSYYSEGADHDPLNLPKLDLHLLKVLVPLEPAKKGRRDKVVEVEEAATTRSSHVVDHIVVLLDVLGCMRDALIRVPRNLMDAYGIQIMTPVVELANAKKEHFLESIKGEYRPYHFCEMDFEIPPKHLPYTTEWSYHNMSLLWEVGRKAGEKFLETKYEGHTYREYLPDREPDGPSPKHPHRHFAE